MINCISCKKQIPSDSDFCPFCGVKNQITNNTPRNEKSILSINTDFLSIEPMLKHLPHLRKRLEAEGRISPSIDNDLNKTSSKRQRYCKLCGGNIDFISKKCTKCQKQYFKFPITNSNVIAVILALALCVSIGFNIFQYNDMTGLINSYHALKVKSEKTERNLKTIRADYRKLDNKCSTIREVLSEYQQNLYFYVPGSRTCHKLGCDELENPYFTDNLKIITWSDARDNGYKTCYRCL